MDNSLNLWKFKNFVKNTIKGGQIPNLNYKIHEEALEYGGCEYTFDGLKYIQRTAKVTPKKIGQFVTLWKRNELGVTAAYEESDDFDFVVIICILNDKEGHFLFSKSDLKRHGIISKNGKRGFRVYPSWDSPLSKQAIQTQAWQQKYFFNGLKKYFKS